MNKDKKLYITAIAIPLIVGITSSLLSSGQMTVYKNLIKPPLSPPAILFPIVWTVLYILMGISSARIISASAPPKEKRSALILYILQLILNFIWPLLFFNKKAYSISFVLIILLWYVVFRMIILFYQIDKKSAYLQIPYLLWLTFATYLNLAVTLLNHG